MFDFSFDGGGFGPGSSAMQYGTMAADSGLGSWDFMSGTSGGGLGMADWSRTLPGVADAGGGMGGSGGPGFWSGMGDTVKEWAGPVSKLLGAGVGLAQIPLAIKGLEASKRGQDILERGASLSERAAAPGIASAERLTPAGTKALLGEGLPEPLRLQVEQQVNQVRQQMLQQLTGAGLDAQTANAIIGTQIEQLRNQLTIQAAQSMLQGGATGASSGGYAGTSGQLGSTEMQQAGGALHGANEAFYRMMGMM